MEENVLKAQQQLQEIEEALAELDVTKETLRDHIVDPLNEIGSSVDVDDECIESIFADLKQLQADLVERYNGLEICKKEVR